MPAIGFACPKCADDGADGRETPGECMLGCVGALAIPDESRESGGPNISLAACMTTRESVEGSKSGSVGAPGTRRTASATPGVGARAIICEPSVGAFAGDGTCALSSGGTSLFVTAHAYS